MILLTGCATGQGAPIPPVKVEIIAFNDLHGNLEPPKRAISAPLPEGGAVRVPAGGVAYLASAIDSLRAANPNHVVVAAGDLVGASPLASALFLDEPTIAAMNLIHLDYSALGNHEFDKGQAELMRLAKGGCEKHGVREPCRLDRPFKGARFGYLAANTLAQDGKPLFPAYALRSFGRGRSRVKVGFIGLTLRAAPTIVNPAGVRGLSFTDEADAANALIPTLRRQGADAIVVLIHQGGQTSVGYDDKSCAGLKGEILPILERLDPAVDLVVSGHTHRAYVCDYGRIDPSRPMLLTSAGLYGTLLTEVVLTIDPGAHRVVGKTANNLIVQNDGYADASGAVAPTPRFPRFKPSAEVAALVGRYAEAANSLAARPVGRLTGPATRDETIAHEMSAANLIADANLAATAGPGAGGARAAFTNLGGVRADLVPAPDGSITYGQLFAAQPFGDALVVMSLTGRQIRTVLEQQFMGAHSVAEPDLLAVSSTLRYGFDRSRPAGSRILDVRLDGAPLEDEASYRIVTNDFLAAGGNGFAGFLGGTELLGGPQDLDTLEAYFAGPAARTPPTPDRIRDLTPP